MAGEIGRRRANVLANSDLITKRLVKARVARAIGEAQDRHGWSDDCAGSALGVCGTTIVNRKDLNDPGKQMTVFELVRSLQHDPEIANCILHLVGFKVERRRPVRDDADDRKKASTINRALLAVSVMLEDGEITDEEIRAHRKDLEGGRDAFDRLLSRIGPKGRVA